MRLPIALLFLGFVSGLQAQVSNISCTDPAAEQAMKDLNDPADDATTEVISDHATIICELRTRISAESLEAHIRKLRII